MQSNSNGFNYPKPKFQSIFESLEERVLFDGVPDATFILPQGDAQEAIPAQVQNIHQADINAPKALIVVDPGVENSEALLSEALQGDSETAYEIRFLNSNEDGVSQISQLLAEADGKYDAIHIISHGDEGEVQLGNSVLTADNLNRYACLLYTSPSPRDQRGSRMPSSA